MDNVCFIFFVSVFVFLSESYLVCEFVVFSDDYL